jgi:uracil-DNA glycosylase
MLQSNHCEKDLADLAFAGLSPSLREKMKGRTFVDVNQVLQRALAHENRAMDCRSHSRFKDNNVWERKGIT